LQLTIFDIFRG